MEHAPMYRQSASGGIYRRVDTRNEVLTPVGWQLAVFMLGRGGWDSDCAHDGAGRHQPGMARVTTTRGAARSPARRGHMASRRSSHNTKDDLQAVRLEQLVLLDDLQVRVQLDPQTVRTYKQIFQDVPEDQCTCPPITVYLHQGSYVVADGFHRVTAARQAGRTTLPAYVRPATANTLDDAWLSAMETNIRHGMPYTREDKQKIVAWFLDHPRYGKRSTRDIAAMTGHHIPHSTVANIRKRREMQELQQVSKLDNLSFARPPRAEQLRQVERAYSRLTDAVAVILGVADELPDAPQELGTCGRAVRESVARLATVMEQLQDEDEDEAAED